MRAYGSVSEIRSGIRAAAEATATAAAAEPPPVSAGGRARDPDRAAVLDWAARRVWWERRLAQLRGAHDAAPPAAEEPARAPLPAPPSDVEPVRCGRRTRLDRAKI